MENIKKHIKELLTLKKGWLFLSVITLICSLCLFALGNNPPPIGGLDYSWAMALHEFFAAKKQFGKEIIFTYGPYGFLFTKLYHPKTYWLTNVFWLFLALIFWWSSFYIAYRLIKNKIFIFLWFFTLFFVFSDPTSPDNIFACFCLFFLIHKLYIKDNFSIFNDNILTFTISIIALIKFSFFLITVPLLILFTINSLFQKHKTFELITFTITFLTFWLLAEQSLFNIPSYLKAGLDVAVYHNYAMTQLYQVPIRDFFSILGVFFLCSLIIFLTLWKKEKFFCLLPSIGFVYFIFVLIKAGYGRFDYFHFIPNDKTLSIITIFYLIFCFEEKLERYIKLLAITTSILMISLLANHLSQKEQNLLSNLTNNIKLFSTNIEQFYLVSRGKLDLDKKYQKEMEDIRKYLPLPKLNGSVDIYSCLQLTTIAHEVDYKSRPIFQSYLTYSPFLLEENLKHLRSTPPDNIIFKIEAIDGRYPSLEDGLIWPELLTKYDVKSFSPGAMFLILERSKEARSYSFVSEKTLEANLGENIEVPNIELSAIWAKIQVAHSILGNLNSKIYKPAPLYLTVITKRGEQVKFLLPPSMSESGFLLSPLIENIVSFSKLASQDGVKQLEQEEITSIKISSDEQSLWQFSPKIKITFSLLSFPRVEVSESVRLVNLSLSQLQNGKYIEAIITAEKLLESNVSQELAYNLIGISFLNMSLTKEAIEVFEKATKIAPNFQQPINNLEEAYQRANKPPNKDKIAKSYEQLGDTYLNNRNFEKSIIYYEKALKLNSKNFKVYSNLAISYSGLELWDKAIDTVNQIIKLEPNSEIAKSTLGKIKLDKAKSQKDKSLK